MSQNALPVGSLLLHIGPHKTGTTAIQASLHEARPVLSLQGVRMAGLTRQPIAAVLSVTERPGMIGERGPDPARWSALVAEMHESGPIRRVLSSEFLADCTDEQVARVIADLDPGVQVVVTLRPLHSILPSQWQQYVQNGLRSSYDSWLTAMFERPAGSPPTGSFWNRHRHDELVARWAAVVGPERVTVVVVDSSDRSMLLRSFEQLLALEPGTLQQPSGESLANRSMTWGEVEMLREVNRLFRELELPAEAYSQLFRHAAVLQMKAERRPGPDEARITTPVWAVQRATELGAQFATAIAASGVRVVGDLDQLAAPPSPGSAVREGKPPAARLPAEAVTIALTSLVAASGVPDAPVAVDEEPVAQRRRGFRWGRGS